MNRLSRIAGLLTGLLLVGQPLRAQSPAPSLQLGLSGLTVQPGTLDADLIVQLIAEKQAEIKKRAVKNTMLRQVNNAGGTIYVFTDNVLDAIINETDNAIRTRTILENTVNLVFAMALTAYIRQSPDPQLRVVLGKLGAQVQLPALPVFRRLFACKPAPAYYNPSRSFQNTRDTDQADDRSFLYTLDIVSEAIRTSKRLEALGLMRITYPGRWASLNQYVSDSATSKRRHYGDTLKSGVDSLLVQLLNNVGFITDQSEVGSFSYPARTLFTLAERKGVLDTAVFYQHLGQTIATLDTMLNNPTPGYQRFRAAHGPALAQYWSYLQRINEVRSDTLTLQQMSDILYHLTVDVQPQFEQVAEFVPQVSRLHAHTQILRTLLKRGVVYSPAPTSETNASLMRLMARLYQFRKARTYSDYLNIMTDLPQLVGDSQIRSTLNTLLSFIKNYVTIRQPAGGAEVVSIDMASLLVMLQTYAQNPTATVQFLFTVGANTAYRSADVRDTVRNFTYLGEKIGLKIKLRDWQYLRSFNKYQTFYRHAGSSQAKIRLQPPQEPVVSNLHLLVFGSGLLYNLLKSSNNTSFHQPLLGIGMGLTFVNSLDVNLSASFPQKSNNAFHENFAHPFVALGFDVLFTEYIDRLSRKRNVVAGK